MQADKLKNALKQVAEQAGKFGQSVRLGVALDSGHMVLAVVSVPFGGTPAVQGIASFSADTLQREHIERFLLEHTAKNCPVAVALSGGRFFLNILTVPPADAQTTQTLMRFEIEKHVPLPLAEVRTGFQVVKSDAQEQRIAFAAIRPDDLEDSLQPLREAGLMPEIAIPAPYAIINALKPFRTEESFSLKTAIHRNAPHEPEPPIALRAPFSSGCWEMTVERGVCTTLRRCSGEPVDQVVLYNGSPLSPDLLAFAELPEAVAHHSAPELAAIGAALVSPESAGMKINMLDSDAASRSLSIASRFPQIACTVAITLLLVLAGYTWWVDTSALSSLEEAMSARKAELTAVEKNLASLKETEARIAALQDFRNNRLNTVGILAELSRTIPSDAWITALTYQPTIDPQKNDKRLLGELALAGYAKSSAKLIGAIEDSPIFEGTEFTGSITKTKQGEGFRIKTQLVRPAAPVPAQEAAPKP